MTERELNLRYGEARADYDRAPSYFNAQAVLKLALQLAAISDDYDDLVDEAHDIMDDTI